MSPETSDVSLNDTSADRLSLQNLVYIEGKLMNQKLNKFLSLNAGVVKADSNSTRGASTWRLGLSNVFVSI